MSEAVTEETRESSLVVIGSSAGGIEAISIQVSTLPVELVTSRSRLEPGKEYVVPSNRQVLIEDGHVEVQNDTHTRARPRPSVDLLFASATKAYGDRLIAVILTGSGSDGAAGAVEVKNAGGTVLVSSCRKLLPTSKGPGNVVFRQGSSVFSSNDVK